MFFTQREERVVKILTIFGSILSTPQILEVKNGDTITFDVKKRELRVEIPVAEIKRRLKKWKAPAPRYKTGVMARYAKLVGSASEGAVLD